MIYFTCRLQFFRYNQLLVQEDEIRAYNAKMKPIWDKEKAEKAAKLNRENMLTLAKEVGVTVNRFYNHPRNSFPN